MQISKKMMGHVILVRKILNMIREKTCDVEKGCTMLSQISNSLKKFYLLQVSDCYADADTTLVKLSKEMCFY